MQAAASLHPKPGCPGYRDSHSCGVGSAGYPREAARATQTRHNGLWAVSTLLGLTWLRSSRLRRSAPGWEGICATCLPKQWLLPHLPLLWLCHGAGCGEPASQPQPFFLPYELLWGSLTDNHFPPGLPPRGCSRPLQPSCCGL